MDEVIQAAKDAQIHDTIQHLEHQYETRVGQKGVNLSWTKTTYLYCPRPYSQAGDVNAR